MKSYSVLWFIYFICTVSATDYCSSDLCVVQGHIACGHNGKFDASCPPDAKMVTITNSMKQLLVEAHNAKRNLIAGGGDKNHKPACRMATMEWDDELAHLATFNVKQCKVSHDCHDTKVYKIAGQNLAWMAYYGTPDHVEELNKAVEMWYSEGKKSNQKYIDAYPDNPIGYEIGHFTGMMIDRNNRVGCAASYYSEANQPYDGYLVACNYAATNMVEYPIYAKCDKAATSCTAGTNPKYPNLCSTKEPIDPNQWY